MYPQEPPPKEPAKGWFGTVVDADPGDPPGTVRYRNRAGTNWVVAKKNLGSSFFVPGPLRRDVRATPREAELRDRRLQVVNAAGKGKGVLAKVPLAEGWFVDVYPGDVYSETAWTKLVELGVTTSTYAVEFPTAKRILKRRDKSSTVYFTDKLAIIDPGVRGLDAFEGSVAAYLNEPTDGEPNCAFVLDYSDPNAPRIEVRTTRPVRAGEELTLCYGSGYEEVRRGYKTRCRYIGTTAKRYVLRRLLDRDAETVYLSKEPPVLKNGVWTPEENFGQKRSGKRQAPPPTTNEPPQRRRRTDGNGNGNAPGVFTVRVRRHPVAEDGNSLFSSVAKAVEISIKRDGDFSSYRWPDARSLRSELTKYLRSTKGLRNALLPPELFGRGTNAARVRVVPRDGETHSEVQKRYLNLMNTNRAYGHDVEIAGLASMLQRAFVIYTLPNIDNNNITTLGDHNVQSITCIPPKRKFKVLIFNPKFEWIRDEYENPYEKNGKISALWKHPIVLRHDGASHYDALELLDPLPSGLQELVKTSVMSEKQITHAPGSPSPPWLTAQKARRLWWSGIRSLRRQQQQQQQQPSKKTVWVANPKLLPRDRFPKTISYLENFVQFGAGSAASLCRNIARYAPKIATVMLGENFFAFGTRAGDALHRYRSFVVKAAEIIKWKSVNPRGTMGHGFRTVGYGPKSDPGDRRILESMLKYLIQILSNLFIEQPAFVWDEDHGLACVGARFSESEPAWWFRKPTSPFLSRFLDGGAIEMTDYIRGVKETNYGIDYQRLWEKLHRGDSETIDRNSADS
jgi:hypothetical protein